MDSTGSKAGSASSAVVNNKNKTPAVNADHKSAREVCHCPPAFDIYGHEVPVLKRYRRTTVSDTALLQPPESWITETSTEAHHKNEMKQDPSAQSQLKIRSIEELRGSKQVADLVTGAFMRKEETSAKLRSKLIVERKEQNLKALEASAHCFDGCKKNILCGVAYEGENDIKIENLLSPWVKFRSETAAVLKEGGSPSNSKNSKVWKLDIIRDRPPIPSLKWRDTSRTKVDVLRDRRASSLQAMQAYRRNIAFPALEKKSLDLTHSLSTPTLSLQKAVPHTDPFKHMKVNIGKGPSKSLETGSKTRTELLRQRVEIFTKEANDTALSAAAFNEADFQHKVEPITNAKGFWWRSHISESRKEEIAKRASRIECERKAKEALATSPIEAHREENIKQAIKLRELKKKLADNISSAPFPDASLVDQPVISKQSFTNVILEFEKAGVVPDAVEHDDPGDYAPMYSSFAPDNIFLEIDDRKELERVRRENKLRKRRSRRIPRRTFKINPKPQDQASCTNSNQAGCLVSGSHAVVGPKGVMLLTQGVHGKQAKGSGVRTGGFQVIDSSRNKQPKTG